jgi:lysophospholipase L1-like esterase
MKAATDSPRSLEIRSLRLVNRLAVGAWLGFVAACSSSPDPGGSGGAPSSGGVQSTGGAPVATGGVSSGGAVATGGVSTGGAIATGGVSTGGAVATGGAGGTGGVSTGGAPSTGGAGGKSIGGTSSGGTSNPTGGAGGASAGGGGKHSGGGGGGGGAAGGTTAGGTDAGGGGSYNPCPTNGDPCKILPLGDSITWGIQYDGAYRVELFAKAVAAGQKVTFTGSLSNGPAMVSNVAFPKSNEGHSGWTISQIDGLVPSPAFTTVPNIVLLMAGTNDVYASSGQAQMPDRLGKLLDDIIKAAPNALLVVGKITPLSNTSWTATIKTYNDAIPGLVQTRAAAGKHILLVDLNTGFTAGMLSSDGVHPNKSGYDFMGDRWYAAISNVLPK